MGGIAPVRVSVISAGTLLKLKYGSFDLKNNTQGGDKHFEAMHFK